MKAREEPFAELWVGDHPNGTSEIHISENPQLGQIIGNDEFIKNNLGQNVKINKLFALDPKKFLG